ncbi:hypothetical protein EV361DRAFT_882882 [Lentinula raphanica]|nr:hypothetical protein EV361DRAFT_882882 [Lentinula raphanica]
MLPDLFVSYGAIGPELTFAFLLQWLYFNREFNHGLGPCCSTLHRVSTPRTSPRRFTAPNVDNIENIEAYWAGGLHPISIGVCPAQERYRVLHEPIAPTDHHLPLRFDNPIIDFRRFCRVLHGRLSYGMDIPKRWSRSFLPVLGWESFEECRAAGAMVRG